MITHATLLSASSLSKNSVLDPRGGKLGKIEEFMLDTSNGKIAYAVLSFGGFMGVGEKFFAIPWSALRLDTEKKAFILDVTKETLKEAKGFDKDHWPDLADVATGTDIHRTFKIRPYWES
ncbi:MAG: PRC-barrel domain-containing protein [Planctomycetes bacterium]|nr:PRC-barrel domain-containing protein [Planctomycetota bacterium]